MLFRSSNNEVFYFSCFSIGLAIAKKLQSDGAKVMISSRKASNVEEALESFTSKENLHGIQCHVGKREDREKLIHETLEKFGAIDILVSNAGTNPVFGPMMEVKRHTVLHFTT